MLYWQATMEKGTSFGAPSVLENVLAKMVIEAVPSVEMVRFTNSGTEVRVDPYTSCCLEKTTQQNWYFGEASVVVLTSWSLGVRAGVHGYASPCASIYGTREDNQIRWLLPRPRGRFPCASRLRCSYPGLTGLPR